MNVSIEQLREWAGMLAPNGWPVAALAMSEAANEIERQDRQILRLKTDLAAAVAENEKLKAKGKE